MAEDAVVAVRGTPAWLLYLLCGTGATATYFLLRSEVYRDVLSALLGLSALAAIAIGVNAYRPIRRIIWHLFALGMLATAVGDFVWIAHAYVAGVKDPFPSPADALYLTAYAVTIAGLLLVQGRNLVRFVDPLIIFTGLFMISWVLVGVLFGGPYVPSFLEGLVYNAYLFACLVMIAVLLRFFLTPESRRAVHYLIFASLVLFLVSNIAYGMSIPRGGGIDAAAHAGLLLYQVLFGAAALHPSMSILSRPPLLTNTKLSWQRLSLLLAAMLIAPGVLAVQTVLGQPVDAPLIVGGSVVLFGLVSIRMAGMIEERKTLEERLAFQASHDPLTELPNRRLFSERVEHAIARLSRDKRSIAVLFIDLDSFKYVNDSLGHDAGDEILVGVGRRLRDCMRPTDTVARLGGDEFTVLLEGVAQVSDATRAAERIMEALRPPLLAGGREVTVTVSIGIALGVPGQETSDLLRAADATMYEAKENGKSRYEVRGAIA